MPNFKVKDFDGLKLNSYDLMLLTTAYEKPYNSCQFDESSNYMMGSLEFLVSLGFVKLNFAHGVYNLTQKGRNFVESYKGY